MKTAANRQRLSANCQSRTCALCGKDGSQGQALGAWTLLVKWAKEAGITLAAPDSRYLDPRCAAKVRALISTHSQGGGI